MEEELLWSQATNERRLNEATRLRAIVILLVVRQRSVSESVRNALTFRRLLPYTRHHLRNVDCRALGARAHHGYKTILISERRQTRLTCLLSRLVQRIENLVLKFLLVRLACVVLEQVQVDL